LAWETFFVVVGQASEHFFFPFSFLFFLVKGQLVNILGFVDNMVSVIAKSAVCRKAAIENM